VAAPAVLIRILLTRIVCGWAVVGSHADAVVIRIVAGIADVSDAIDVRVALKRVVIDGAVVTLVAEPVPVCVGLAAGCMVQGV